MVSGVVFAPMCRYVQQVEQEGQDLTATNMPQKARVSAYATGANGIVVVDVSMHVADELNAIHEQKVAPSVVDGGDGNAP